MSLTSRLLGRLCFLSVPKVVRAQRTAFSAGLSRMRYKKPQRLFCQNHNHRFASDAANEPCWKCGKLGRQAKFFCGDCNALQKPDLNCNFFHLLGFSEGFDIDSRDLSKKFRQLQALLHPDKFSNASEYERTVSADFSSLINKAYRTLSDPLERGLYLLSLRGAPVLEENTSLNKAFLLEIMELNEELESISCLAEMKSFHSRNQDTLGLLQEKVSKSFAGNDILSARAFLMEMKYFITLEGKIKEKILQLDTV